MQWLGLMCYYRKGIKQLHSLKKAPALHLPQEKRGRRTKIESIIRQLAGLMHVEEKQLKIFDDKALIQNHKSWCSAGKPEQLMYVILYRPQSRRRRHRRRKWRQQKNTNNWRPTEADLKPTKHTKYLHRRAQLLIP